MNTRIPICLLASKPSRTIAALAALLTLAASTQASMLVQPGGSIQQALDLAAASPGPDTVLISAGTYQENITIADADPVKLLGIGGVTILSTDPDAHIITVQGGDVTLQNLSVTGGDDGINAFGCDSLTLISVDSSGNGDEGIDAEDVVNMTVLNSSIAENGDHGLQVEGNSVLGNLTIRNSHFVDNDGDGIKVSDAHSVLAVNVLCTGNDDGMDWDDVASIEVRNSEVNNNGDEGLEVDGAGSVLVVSSTFQSNVGEGIDTDDVSQVSLISVSCTFNGGSGFQTVAEGEDTGLVSILSSSFVGNGRDGIQLLEEDGAIASVALAAVIARDNVESGLHIAISGTVSQRGVTSENNGAADILP